MLKQLVRRVLSLDETGDASSVQQGDRPTSIAIHSQGVGSTGTQSYSGYTAEEYLSTLRGRNRADIFDRMERSDGQISMCLKAVTDPILSSSWDVEPGEDTPEAKDDAEFIKHLLFCDMEKPFEEFLEEALTFLVHGHSVFEVTHKVVLNHPEFGSYNGIKGLAFRAQRTIERWNLDPTTDQLKSVSQIVYGDLSRYVDIPAEFLIVFTLKKRGSNYEGISALRPCYGNFIRKDLYLKLNVIGVERHAVPPPVVKIPDGKAEGEQYENLISALEAYTSHERNYLTIPAGWEIDFERNVYDPQKVEVSIDNEDKRITKAFLANFLELGISGAGTQSLSVDLSDFFLNSLDQVANRISSTINKDLIPSLMKMNRGERAKYPKLKHSGISDRAGKELSEVLSNLRNSDFITPSDADEVHLRKRLGIPEMSDIGVRKKAVPQPGFGAKPGEGDNMDPNMDPEADKPDPETDKPEPKPGEKPKPDAKPAPDKAAKPKLSLVERILARRVKS